MKNLVAITIGDINGIGIRLLYKEWKNNKIKNFVLITNISILKKYNEKNINLNKINIIKKLNMNDYDFKKINIINIRAKNRHENALNSLKKAYELAKKEYFIGILTLPLNKQEIKENCSVKFIDQTSFFSKLEKVKNSNMIFMYKNKFFIPLTTHIELNKVTKFFKNKNNDIYNKIKNIYLSVKEDFNLNYPRIIMAGINPHAGENGTISNDDLKLLDPIIKKLKKNDIKIDGPVSGDAIINKRNLKNYDVFIFTYHDQALIPFKMISEFKGINFTSNLKIIRVSPSHGTAKDLKTNLATTLGIRNSVKSIRLIYENRNKVKSL